MEYTNNQEYDQVLESYFDSINELTSNSKQNSKFLIPIDEYCSYDVITEAAKFNFFGKIKQNDSLKKVWDEAKKAESMLNANGEPTKKGVIDFCSVALRILVILQDISSWCAVPALLLIFPIPAYLVARAVNWAMRIGEDALGKSKAEDVKNKLLLLKSKTKDKKVKDTIDKQIEKIDKSLETLENTEE